MVKHKTLKEYLELIIDNLERRNYGLAKMYAEEAQKIARCKEIEREVKQRTNKRTAQQLDGGHPTYLNMYT